MDSTDFILRDSEATSQIKRLQADTHQRTSTPKRLSASITLSVLLHGCAIAAVAGIVNEFSNATAIPTSTVITAHLVTESSITTNAVEANDAVSTSKVSNKPESSVVSSPNKKPVEVPDQGQVSPEQPANQTVETKHESVVRNVESPKQIPKEETPDTEIETVEPPEIPTKNLETNVPQPDESEPDAVTEKKSTQESVTKPTVSDVAKAIESKINAVAAENSARNNAPSSESALTNEQPIVLAKADRSVIGGVEQRRDAAPTSGNAKPRYPRVAIKKGYEGRVVLHVTVSVDGDVKNVAVGTGSGYRSLDKSAMKTVKRWRFEPAIKNGKAVESVAEVPVVFRLIDAKS